MSHTRAAVHMYRRGLLTAEQAESAFLYCSEVNVEQDEHTVSDQTLMGDVSLSRNDCIKFAEWIIISGILESTSPDCALTLTKFIMRMVSMIAFGAARYLNERTDAEFRYKGFRYFHDACFSGCLNTLFGGTHLRFLRIDTFEFWGEIGIREGGEIFNKRVVTMAGLRIVMAETVQAHYEQHVGKFMCVQEIRTRPGYWRARGKIAPSSYLLRIAMKAVRNNFVAMEVGPSPKMQAGHKLIRLGKVDAEDSRSTLKEADLLKIVGTFVTQSKDITTRQAEILETEYKRPPASKMNAHVWYMHQTGAQIAQMTFYRELNRAQEAFAEYFRNLQEE